jgi:branched-subunit amino acid aminotransferase/4-amino-4-deoxychorismate lyase/sugar phosphate isomerase/epimerase
VIVSAFADEIASDLDAQAAVLKRHGIGHVDLRGVGGRNVIELTDEQAVALREGLRTHGLSVAAIASPIGKEPADTDASGLRRRMLRAAAIARLLDTRLVRVFGFHRPGGGDDWRESSLRCLRLLASCARETGVTLLLENELATRADSIEHTVDLLASLADDHLRAAFDPANALRCGETPYPDGYARLKPWLRELHVKDLDKEGRVVPAGFGTADWPSLVDALREDGYDGIVSLEPHLAHAGRGGGFTGPSLFGEAHRALRALMTSNGTRPTRGHDQGDSMDRTLAPAKYSSPTDEDWQGRGWRSTGWPFLACVDGRITPPRDAFVPATDEGFLRGDGAFEVLHVYGGRPFELDRHIDRFARTCEALLLDFPRAAILADLALLLEEAGSVDCLWRVLVARGGTRLHLLEWVPPEKRRSVPLALRTVRYQPTVVLSNLKPMSYGANMAASRRARHEGGDEGLFVHPDGTVLEAPTASVFWAVDGVLKTPALELGILPSITRMVIMEALETVEVSAGIDELRAADEVFLASTSREIQPVGRIDDVEYEAPGPLCRAARRALDEAIAREARSEGPER